LSTSSLLFSGFLHSFPSFFVTLIYFPSSGATVFHNPTSRFPPPPKTASYLQYGASVCFCSLDQLFSFFVTSDFPLLRSPPSLLSLSFFFLKSAVSFVFNGSFCGSLIVFFQFPLSFFARVLFASFTASFFSFWPHKIDHVSRQCEVSCASRLFGSLFPLLPTKIRTQLDDAPPFSPIFFFFV